METETERLEARVRELEKEILTLKEDEIPVVLKDLVTFFHLQLCPEKHNGDCAFYLEESQENPWICEDHVRWAKVVVEILDLSGLHLDNLKDQAEIGRVCEVYKRAKVCSPAGFTLLMWMLNFDLER